MRHWLLGLAVCALIGCESTEETPAAPPRQVVERSHDSKPRWVNRIPEEGGYTFYRGQRLDAASREDAEVEARANAVEQASQELEQFVQTEFDAIKRREAANGVDEHTEAVVRRATQITSENVIRGLRMTESYWEYVSLQDGQRYVYDVYVLMRIDNDVASTSLSEALEAAETELGPVVERQVVDLLRVRWEDEFTR